MSTSSFSSDGTTGAAGTVDRLMDRRAVLGAGAGAVALAVAGGTAGTAAAAPRPSGQTSKTDAPGSEGNLGTRLVVEVPFAFDEAVARFEGALPQIPVTATLAEQAAAGGRDGLAAYLESLSPYGFFLFYKLNPTALMNLLGDPARCTTYLVGNPSIAETMYRYDAGIFQYAPLRMTLHEDHEQNVRFLIDQPSLQLGTFGSEQISDIGHGLDKRVGKLLGGIGFPVPAVLA